MRIQILKIDSKGCEEVQIKHIYPKGHSQIFYYRRYGPAHWCCDLGLHGWHRNTEPDMLEEAYQVFMRQNANKPKAVNK